MQNVNRLYVDCIVNIKLQTACRRVICYRTSYDCARHTLSFVKCVSTSHVHAVFVSSIFRQFQLHTQTL